MKSYEIIRISKVLTIFCSVLHREKPRFVRMEKTAVTCVAWLPRGVCTGRLDGAQDVVRRDAGRSKVVNVGWNGTNQSLLDMFGLVLFLVRQTFELLA